MNNIESILRSLNSIFVNMDGDAIPTKKLRTDDGFDDDDFFDVKVTDVAELNLRVCSHENYASKAILVGYPKRNKSEPSSVHVAVTRSKNFNERTIPNNSAVKFKSFNVMMSVPTLLKMIEIKPKLKQSFFDQLTEIKENNGILNNKLIEVKFSFGCNEYFKISGKDKDKDSLTYEYYSKNPAKSGYSMALFTDHLMDEISKFKNKIISFESKANEVLENENVQVFKVE